MTIHWSVFVPGALLLLFPADFLLSSLVELHRFDYFQKLEDSPRYRPWWWVPALWIDPLRGFAGTWLLQRAFALSVPWALAPRLAYTCLVGMLVLGILSQLFTRRGDQEVLLAPLGFAAGMIVALTPWSVSLLGLITAAVGLFAFRQFNAFFAFGFVAIALLGLAFGASLMWLVPGVGAFALPILAGFLTGRTLELPIRNASRPTIPAPGAK